jgi:hypothetical protein
VMWNLCPLLSGYIISLKLIEIALSI